MATRAMKMCNYPSCNALVTSGYCDRHKPTYKNYDRNRASSHERGYTRQWQKVRELYLKQFPLCVECAKNNSVVSATVVDHIRPHKGDQQLFWNRENWQPLCKRCHDKKTAREDGGFGRC